MDIRKEIKMRTLKSIRADLGLNQDEMARVLQMSRSTYAQKERGVRQLLAIELRRISKLSSVPMEEIVIPK